MIKCPSLFSLPRIPESIAISKLSTLRATIRSLCNNRIEALNVDHFKSPISLGFLGSEEKQGNKIEVIT